MSYIRLYLDTTAPNIEIINPKYTTKDAVNEITIDSNEDLSNYQNIYIIDSNNNRHDYSFTRIGMNRLFAEISFENLSIGTATIFAELEDEVGNRSELVRSTIEIRESISMIKIASDVINMSKENDSTSMFTEVYNEDMRIDEERYIGNTKISSKKMNKDLYIDN